MPSERQRAIFARLIMGAVFWLAATVLVDIQAWASGRPQVDKVYQSLYTLIRDTPIESMTERWLIDKVYRGHPDRQVYLKKILSTPDLAAKSAKMARLRQAILLEFLGQVAKTKGWTLEITNQGKTVGHASDLDVTAWVSDVRAEGVRVKRFKNVVDMWHDWLGRKGLTEGLPDMTMFNGDEFLPDWTNARAGTGTFYTELAKNIVELRKNAEAYYVPGANKSQTHNRALREGRTYHVSWDPVAERMLLNGEPFNVKNYVAGTEKLTPLLTRDKAKRYHGVKAAAPWRNALGNAIQNLDNFMSHTGDPLARQKYANRVLNEAFAPITEVGEARNYAEVYLSDLPADQKLDFKKKFIAEIYGDTLSPAQVKRIIEVHDTSVQIENDKGKVAYEQAKAGYYKPFLRQAERQLQRERTDLKGAAFDKAALARAERIFVDEQVKLLARGAVKVLENAMYRDLTQGRRGRLAIEGRASAGETPGAWRANVRKLVFERKVEMAFLFETVLKIPDAALRKNILERIQKSAPTPELKATLQSLEALARGGKQMLDGWLIEIAKSGKMVDPDEFIARKKREMGKVIGEDVAAAAQRVDREALNRRMLEGTYHKLGPAETRLYIQALEAIKANGAAYLNRAWEEANYLAVMGTAVNLVRVAERQCLDRQLTLQACVPELGYALAQEIPWYLPGVNVGTMVWMGWAQIEAGDVHGLVTWPAGMASGIGLASQALGYSVPLAAPGLHIYFAYRLGEGVIDVTYGYVVDTQNEDLVEQALKAAVTPDGQVRRCESVSLPTTLPDFPLLSDKIKGPSETEGWSQAKRLQKAREMFGTSVNMTLIERGLTPQSPQWKAERARLFEVRTCELPYYERMARLYETFRDDIDRYLNAAARNNRNILEDQAFPVLDACVTSRTMTLEAKRKAAAAAGAEALEDYQAEAAIMPSPFAQCLPRALEKSSPIVRNFFAREVGRWFKAQREVYRDEYSTTIERMTGAEDAAGSNRNTLLNKIVDVLVREYLIGEYTAERRAEAAAEVERALTAHRARAEKIKQLAAALVTKEVETAARFADAYANAWEKHYTRTIATAKPRLALALPTYPLRLGADKAPMEVSVLGEWAGGDIKDPANDWQVDFDTETVPGKMHQGAPKNLIVTPALADEMAQPENADKDIYTVEQKVVARLRDGSGKVLDEQSGTLVWYDLLADPKKAREPDDTQTGRGPDDGAATSPAPTVDLEGILNQMRALRAAAKATSARAEAACRAAEGFAAEVAKDMPGLEGEAAELAGSLGPWRAALEKVNALSDRAESLAGEAKTAATRARENQTKADAVAKAACDLVPAMRAAKTIREREGLLTRIKSAVGICKALAQEVRANATDADGAAAACSALAKVAPSLMPRDPLPTEKAQQLVQSGLEAGGRLDAARATLTAARGSIAEGLGIQGRAKQIGGEALVAVADIDLAADLKQALAEIAALQAGIGGDFEHVRYCPDRAKTPLEDLGGRQAAVRAAGERVSAQMRSLGDKISGSSAESRIGEAVQQAASFAEIAGWSASGMEEILIAVATCQASAEKLAAVDPERQAAEAYCGRIPGMEVVPHPNGNGWACQCADPNTDYDRQAGQCVPVNRAPPAVAPAPPDTGAPNLVDPSGCWLLRTPLVSTIRVRPDGPNRFRGVLEQNNLEYFSTGETVFIVERLPNTSNVFSGTEFAYSDRGMPTRLPLRLMVQGGAMSYATSDFQTRLTPCP